MEKKVVCCCRPLRVIGDRKSNYTCCRCCHHRRRNTQKEVLSPEMNIGKGVREIVERGGGGEKEIY